MAVTRPGNGSALNLFAVVDSCGADLGMRIADRLSRRYRAMGVRTLVMAAAAAGRNGDLKKLSQVTRHMDRLEGDALRGYIEGGRGDGILAIDASSIDAQTMMGFRGAYDLLLFSFGAGIFDFKFMDVPAVPALVVIGMSGARGPASAKEFVDRMLCDGHLPRPVGFVISGGTGLIGPRLSQRLCVPSWGMADDTPHVAERAMSRFAALRRQDPACAPGRDAGGDAGFANVGAIIGDVVGPVADGIDPLGPLLRDPGISEIMVNGPGSIYVERDGAIEKVAARFKDDDQLLAAIERMAASANRRIDESSPMVDARLPDGSRLNAVIRPLAVDGPLVTVRRFMRRLRTMDDIVEGGMLSREMAELLVGFVRSRASIVISGGTGSGKTTLLGILASAITDSERIITIEDSAELLISAGHVVRLEARPPNIEGAGAVAIRDLVRNALRMRPDRIVVGECRGPEALDMLQAMNTGHEGSLTSVHANSPRDAIARMETMVLMAGLDLPLVAVREQIVRAVDIIVQVARGASGARRVVEISELTGMEGQTPCMQAIAALDADSGELRATGMRPRFHERKS